MKIQPGRKAIVSTTAEQLKSIGIKEAKVVGTEVTVLRYNSQSEIHGPMYEVSDGMFKNVGYIIPSAWLNLKPELPTKTFQIEQNWGSNCGGFIYFDISIPASFEEIEKAAIAATQEDWNEVIPSLYFTPPKPCRPTIHVYEYQDGQRVKGGLKFKTKWR